MLIQTSQLWRRKYVGSLGLLHDHYVKVLSCWCSLNVLMNIMTYVECMLMTMYLSRVALRIPLVSVKRVYGISFMSYLGSLRVILGSEWVYEMRIILS